MAAVNLIFRSGANTAPADALPLVFGAEEALTDGSIHVDLSKAPTLAMVGGEVQHGDLAIDLTATPTLAMTGTVDNAVSRGPRRSVRTAWEGATLLQASTASGWDSSTSRPLRVSQQIVDAVPLEHATSTAWDESLRALLQRRTAWQEAAPVRTHTVDVVSQEGARYELQRSTAWEAAVPVRPHSTTIVYQETRRTKRATTARWEEAQPMRRSITSVAADADGLVRSWVVPWDEAKRPPPGKSEIIPPPPPAPDLCYTPPRGDDVELTLEAAWGGPQDTQLTFICDNHPPYPPATITVPIREVYMVANDVSLTLADGTVIPTSSFSLSLDYQSWTWGLTATVTYGSLAMFGFDEAGDPVQVWAHVNGQVFKLFVQTAVSTRQFPNGNIQLTGIGLISTLDAPYSPTLTFDNAGADQTAQQIANTVLTDNGVTLGWAVEWALTDWLVPAAAWSFQGTYATALQAIASAAGGYLQPHPTDQTARILPLYPTAPWDWGTLTPDYELPAAAVQIEGITWSSMPVYNVVYVSGGNSSGVLAQVKRTGTAGDLEAAMVTDQLITHADAARQRGTAILANTGQQALVSLKLPVLSETGVILPGKFVRYVDGATTRIGLVRSLTVDVAYPAVWQTIGVETHVD